MKTLLSNTETFIVGGTIISVVVTIIAVLVGIRTYLKNKKDEKRKLESKQKIEENNQKHLKNVQTIIENGYNPDKTGTVIHLYTKWCTEIFPAIQGNAKKKDVPRLRKLKDENKPYEYFPKSLVYEDPKIPASKEVIVMKDCFTSTFPSLHDMADWALGCKLTELFVLQGYYPGGRVLSSVVHVKNHFVNHSMIQGIIQFDLYIHALDVPISEMVKNKEKSPAIMV